MDIEQLPPQLRPLMRGLEQAIQRREPAVRARVDALRVAHPHHTNHELAHELIRSTRRRVATSGAISGAASVVPALGTAVAVGAVAGQTFYALEQEIELVLGIAILFGHELGDSEDRLLEALVVVGATSGALKLRQEVMVVGGERLALVAFRRMPRLLIAHGGGRMLARILSRVATTGAAKVAARVIPLGVGIALGAGFDWVAVTGLGRAAVRYYGPGGPGARPLLLAPEDSPHVEVGH